jgi:hypothetical protein
MSGLKKPSPFVQWVLLLSFAIMFFCVAGKVCRWSGGRRLQSDDVQFTIGLFASMGILPEASWPDDPQGGPAWVLRGSEMLHEQMKQGKRALGKKSWTAIA